MSAETETILEIAAPTVVLAGLILAQGAQVRRAETQLRANLTAVRTDMTAVRERLAQVEVLIDVIHK